MFRGLEDEYEEQSDDIFRAISLVTAPPPIPQCTHADRAAGSRPTDLVTPNGVTGGVRGQGRDL